jgi:hypothetical protein
VEQKRSDIIPRFHRELTGPALQAGEEQYIMEPYA